MRRLIWGFAGRTYHIVGNLMSRLNFSLNDVLNNDMFIAFVQILSLYMLSFDPFLYFVSTRLDLGIYILKV